MDSPQFRKKVGENIKNARINAKLTQAEAAKKAGINVNYFAVIERGEVTTSGEKLENISKALGTTVDELTKSK